MPLDDDVSPPLAAGMVVWFISPRGRTGVGRGGGMVSRASGTPIYILIYILHFISQIPITYTDKALAASIITDPSWKDKLDEAAPVWMVLAAALNAKGTG